MEKKIVVILHLYYQDLWPEFSKYLENIEEPFDLCISTCKDHDQSITEDIKKTYPFARIIALDNRGADIGPFFEWINILIKEGRSYEYLLKIHTKKRLFLVKKPEDYWISEWERNRCINPLISSKEVVRRNLEVLRENAVGILGSKQSFISDEKMPPHPNLIEAEDYMIDLMKKFDIKTERRAFFGGSMFWCKYQVLSKYFSRYELDLEYFPLGFHSGGGTAAHAAERLFGRIFLNEGMKIVFGEGGSDETLQECKQKKRKEDMERRRLEASKARMNN